MAGSLALSLQLVIFYIPPPVSSCPFLWVVSHVCCLLTLAGTHFPPLSLKNIFHQGHCVLLWVMFWHAVEWCRLLPSQWELTVRHREVHHLLLFSAPHSSCCTNPADCAQHSVQRVAGEGCSALVARGTHKNKPIKGIH